MDAKKILPFVIFLFAECSNTTSIDSITTIDVQKAYDHTNSISLSEFSTNEIEYIALETHPDGLFTFGKMYAFDKYIVVQSFPRILLFDRQTGKFIRQITRQGSDYNQFTGFHHTYFVNENSLTLSFPDILGGIEYDFEGNVVRKIRFPDKDARLKFFPLDEKRYAVFRLNTGNDADKLYIVDYDGNELNRFPNNHSYDATKGVDNNFGFIASKWNNNIIFYENFVDTLYQITNNNDIIPYYHIYLGKYQPPYSEKPFFFISRNPERPLSMDYIMIYSISESDKFLFFSFTHDKKDRRWTRRGFEGMPVSRYFGFYDKQSGNTKIAEEDQKDKSPVINDIDNFATIYPFYMTINQCNEMTTYIEAEDIVEWFIKNPEKSQ